LIQKGVTKWITPLSLWLAEPDGSGHWEEMFDI
jgi:hypothetical protein